ncbi:hypothetical protein [Chryseobacterium indoltheticum]|jgi:hypothetical protein|uniref:EpsG family protein n=1 Tax=Chryseobacterium indoltheticum TaxID=254 RepID=A0A381FR61_9FLAO|nr:hypothetical protein [Chryseobacterium indoltheticum]AZA62919.1 hypothetical protein EG340_18675 [Chryseobacterium indoltheticum]MDF2831627.1 hypothetical protein [Chryseobacterium indoltheticum]QQQ28205.1 hypothetical protein JJL46_19385 [Chryseobacterium indoltheticum]SUX48632.1 Uncharacterised protein [Chryseobacterium indoltheticum]
MIKTSKEVKLYVYFGLLLSVLTYVTIQLYIKSTLPQVSWTASDWLINYEDGGFKRRGLSGSFLFFCQDQFHISLPIQILCIQVIFFCFIFYFLIRIILTKKINWDILILICSPLCLLYLPVSIFNSGRKEIILLALILFFMSGKSTQFKKYFLFGGFILGLFLHELFYFYLPFVMAAYILKTKKIDVKYLGSLFFVSTFIIIILFFFGGEINQGQSIKILNNRGIELNKWNIFTYDAVKERKDMLVAYQSYILFSLELIFMTFLSFFFVKKHLPQYKNAFKIFILVSLVWVSPLYYLGADWFRWNHIYSFLLIILIISALPDYNGKSLCLEGRFNIPLLIIIALFFVEFYLHIQYDSAGNSAEYLLDFIESKLHLKS